MTKVNSNVDLKVLGVPRQQAREFYFIVSTFNVLTRRLTGMSLAERTGTLLLPEVVGHFQDIFNTVRFLATKYY